MEYVEEDQAFVEIPLTKGLVALVDKEDYERIKHLTWCASQGYACTSIDGVMYSMHRYILGYTGELDIDHINNNRCDNRRSNLRIVSRTINNLNRAEIPSNVKQRYLARGNIVYDARVQVNYVTIHLGTFSTELRARIVIDRAVANVINEVGYVIALKRPHRWGSIEKVKIVY